MAGVTLGVVQGLRGETPPAGGTGKAASGNPISPGWDADPEGAVIDATA